MPWVSGTPNQPCKDSTAKGGLPLVFFGAYLWTSCAGDLLPVEGGNQARLCAKSGNKSRCLSRTCTTVTVTTGAKKDSKPCVSQPDLFFEDVFLELIEIIMIFYRSQTDWKDVCRAVWRCWSNSQDIGLTLVLSRDQLPVSREIARRFRLAKKTDHFGGFPTIRTQFEMSGFTLLDCELEDQTPVELLERTGWAIRCTGLLAALCF